MYYFCDHDGSMMIGRRTFSYYWFCIWWLNCYCCFCCDCWETDWGGYNWYCCACWFPCEKDWEAVWDEKIWLLLWPLMLLLILLHSPLVLPLVRLIWSCIHLWYRLPSLYEMLHGPGWAWQIISNDCWTYRTSCIWYDSTAYWLTESLDIESLSTAKSR